MLDVNDGVASGMRVLDGPAYQSYLYAYPHKTAYRPLRPPIALAPLWAAEDREALFLYLHIPFCEMRCGYCNLFSQAYPASELVERYLNTLARQATVVREALGRARFARLALGGGTPTLLSVRQLERLLDLANQLGAHTAAIPVSIETSPETIDGDKLRLLCERGVDRISIGVQSFVDAEVQAVHRRQSLVQVDAALDLLRRSSVATLNIDLIYGLPGQSTQSFVGSINAALRFRPEEIYLYPLYVRPLTLLHRAADGAPSLHGLRDVDDADERVTLYRAGRDRLLEAGYEQISMRMFRAATAPASEGTPLYCCQQDGMVGLGCGARSYTRGLHYSGEYAVGAQGVRAIIEAYLRKDDADFAAADYGFVLDAAEQRRRYVILSLLSREGLCETAYARRFESGETPRQAVPELELLLEAALARIDSAGRLQLTSAGLERSDAIGPLLCSTHVKRLMADYTLH